ncbi:MAG TPA: hypothetical protein ENK18_11750 [Deltaproteobacteria bacterium]|nr:hypothetical protein [Deltaproteobacteria bacterium]
MLALLLALLLALSPHAAAADVLDPEAAEEIIVYADDFARWDDTRWWISAELILPMGVTFARDMNQSFSSYAFQIQAVIACGKDHRLSKRRWEVSCEIEDVGLLATSLRRWRTERDRQLVEDVLAEIDAKLTGLKVQLQTDFKGGVTNIDLEGLETRNERQRAIQESLRQVVGRVMAGFHLRIPDHAQREGQWVEYRSALMQMPSLTASKGSTTLLHLVTPQQGLQIVQTVGEGTVAVSLPVQRMASAGGSGAPAAGGSGAPAARGDASTSGGLGPASAAPPSAVEGPDLLGVSTSTESDLDATYSLHATGVAVFDRSTGIMTERVWAVQGEPTASSAGGTRTAPFRNVGRIQLLGPDEAPDLGPSTQIALPGQTIEGLGVWRPLEGML